MIFYYLENAYMSIAQHPEKRMNEIIENIAREMFPDWYVTPSKDRQWRIVLDGLKRAYTAGRNSV